MNKTHKWALGGGKTAGQPHICQERDSNGVGGELRDGGRAVQQAAIERHVLQWRREADPRAADNIYGELHNALGLRRT